MDNKQIEETVLGILLRTPSLLTTQPIEIEWFLTYRKVITGIMALASKGIEVDVLTVAEETGLALDKIAALQLETFGAKENYGHYLKELQKRHQALMIRNLLNKSLESLNNGEESEAVVSKFISETLRDSRADDCTHDMDSALVKFIDHLELTFDSKDSGGIGLKTGIARLDNALGGMHPSDLVIVGARPGVGKTAFSTTVCLNIARLGKKVGFFSTEMSVIQLTSRMASIQAHIAAKKLRDADLSEQEYTRLTAASIALKNAYIKICDKPSIKASEIIHQSKLWQMNGGMDFIIVDYLTRIRSDNPSGNQNLDVGEIVTQMKNIARMLKIPVMVLAQLNRNSESRADRRPRCSDLRDSGIIEQEADQILLLHRPEYDPDNPDNAYSEIIVDKNRHGECGIVQCAFVQNLMKWDNLDEYHEENYQPSGKSTRQKTGRMESDTERSTGTCRVLNRTERDFWQA